MGEAAFFLNGPVTNTLGRTWIHLLWQGLTVGLLLAGAEAMFGPRSAVGRYRIAGASLLLLAVLPAVALLIPYPAFALPAEGSAFFLWIVAFWLAGSGLLGLRLAVGWLLIQRLVGRATPDNPVWEARLACMAGQLGIRQPIRLRESALVDGPLTCGWRRPVVFLPTGLSLQLPPRQVEALLLHELAHIRRGDYQVNLLQSLLEIAFFFHPVVWWLSRRLRLEREFCCDDAAVALCGSRKTYVQALNAIAAPREAGLGLTLAAGHGKLLRRVQRLAGHALAPQSPRLTLTPLGARVRLPGGRPMEFVHIQSDGHTAPHGFHLGKYVVTQAQWQAVMDSRPWAGRPHVIEDPERPAVGMSYDEALEFVQQLNQLFEERLFRLPGGAEWEYASRAGRHSQWFFGNDPAELGLYAWYRDNAWEPLEEEGHLQPVGLKLPNPWGLYDIHGNVNEWVQGRALRSGNISTWWQFHAPQFVFAPRRPATSGLERSELWGLRLALQLPTDRRGARPGEPAVRKPAAAVAAPGLLTPVGTVRVPGGTVQEFALDGPYLYVAADYAGLKVYELADPDRPVLIGQLPANGRTSGVALSGGYAYVTANHHRRGFQVVDLSTPAKPKQVASLSHERTADVAIAGHYAFFATWYQGLWVVDISRPQAPRSLNHYPFANPGLPHTVILDGSYAYLATRHRWGEPWDRRASGGLQIFDISDPLEVRWKGAYDDAAVLGEMAVEVALRGQFAYYPDEQGLKVVDIGDPTQPRLVGRVDMGIRGPHVSGYARYGITLSGNYALVGAGRMGLEVFEIADPQAPRLLETYPTEGIAGRSIYTDTHLYLGDDDGGIQIFRHGLGEG